jgi:2-haloacid dehalogenase
MPWILFDLNGTLLDPATMADAWGGGEQARRVAHGALHDAVVQAMADTLGGEFRPLPELLRAGLERRAQLAGLDLGQAGAAAKLAERMRPYPDAAAALDTLGQAGMRLGVLTNSAQTAAERALREADLLSRVEVVLGADAVRRYKPHPAVYEHALVTLHAAPASTWLVANHAWDVGGAKRSGLRTAWIAREERVLLESTPRPDLEANSLLQAAVELVGGGRRAA